MKRSLFILKIAVAGYLLVLGSGCTSNYPIEPIIALENSNYQIGDTTYLELTPPIMGFNNPTALFIGKDNLLYVADTKNNRILMMDVSGRLLGARHVLQPISITQDFRLDLLVGCCIVQPNGDTVGVIIRIHLYNAMHILEQAVVDTVWKETAQPERRIVGISTMPNNSYLVARNGPDNRSIIDPDTRVMRFSAADKYITPVTDLVTTTNGTGINYINQLTGISTIPNSSNFIVLQKSVGVGYGAIMMSFSSSSDFEGWQPTYDPSNPKDAAVDLVHKEWFVYPTGVAIDNNRLDVFICDAAQDSVFRFNSRGRFRKESFGFYKTGRRMKYPTGVAIFDKILYVADGQANCIFRFKLSTDF